MEEYLSTRYATSSSKYTCEFCNFVAKNKAALSSHLRGCSVKKTSGSDQDTNQIISIET